MLSIDEQLSELTVGEKLALALRLWDDVAASEEPFPLGVWSREEARRRIAELKQDPTLGIDEAEVWRRVGERRD